MNIILFAGNQSKRIAEELNVKGAGSFSVVNYYDDFESGMQEVISSGKMFDKMLMLKGVINSSKEGVVYDLKNVLDETVDVFKEDWPDSELVFATTEQSALNEFNLAVGVVENCRGYVTKQITMQALKEMLLNKFNQSEEVVEVDRVPLGIKNKQVESVPEIVSKPEKSKIGSILGGFAKKKEKVVKENVVAVTNQVETVDRKVVKEEPVKHRESVDISSFQRNKVILVTGDRSSGVTGSACNMARLAAECGVKTCIIDLDLIGKGVSIIFDRIESLSHDRNYEVALLSALRNVSTCSENICPYNYNEVLGHLGLPLCTDEYDIRLNNVTGDSIEDLVQYLQTYFSTVIIDCHIEDLIKYPTLTKLSTNIVFCTSNGYRDLLNASRFFNPDFFGKDSKSNLIYSVFVNKCGILVTNFDKACKMSNGKLSKANTVCDSIEYLSGSDLDLKLLGVIETNADYRNQKHNKMLIDDKLFRNEFMGVLQKIYKM